MNQEIKNFNLNCSELLEAKIFFPGKNPIYQFGFEIDVKEHWDEGGFNGIFGETTWSLDEMKFHEDWNWLMYAVAKIYRLGFRKYSYSHEEHSRTVFTDMAILKQKHDFGGGNIVADSGKCKNEKEALIQAIKDFFANKNNL